MSQENKAEKDHPPLRTATLNFWSDGDALWASFRNHETCESLGQEKLNNMTLSKLTNELCKLGPLLSPVAGDSIWSIFQDPLAKPPNDKVKSVFDSHLEQVVSAGSSLFSGLSENQHFCTILQTIDNLPPDSRLTIETDIGFLPWEILYPLPYNKDWTNAKKAENRIQHEKLWGYRFSIECILLQRGESFKPPFSKHQSGKAFVSLNLNPTIDEELKNSQLKPLDYHRKFYESDLHEGRGELHTTGEEVKTLLLSRDCQATIIYLYCHGSNDTPFGQQEKLELDKNDTINPSFLNDESKFLRGPIIILNSCSSAAYSALTFATFLSKFRTKGALGLVGTSFTVPATFAAAFGRSLIKSYLAGVPIGKSLLNIRRDLLDKGGNPMGLFYSLQCHMHITAPASKEATP